MYTFSRFFADRVNEMKSYIYPVLKNETNKKTNPKNPDWSAFPDSFMQRCLYPIIWKALNDESIQTVDEDDKHFWVIHGSNAVLLWRIFYGSAHNANGTLL